MIITGFNTPFHNSIILTRHRTQQRTDADSEEEFYSCGSSFDLEDDHDLDLTKAKEVVTLEDAPVTSLDYQSADTAGNRLCAVDDNSDNWVQVQVQKELGGKNILASEGM